MKRKHAPLLLLVIGAILAAPAAGQVTELGVTANASPSNVQTGDNVTLTATVDGGVGPYTVTYYRASSGTTCADPPGNWTQIGSSGSDPPYTVSWTPNTAGSPYAVKAEAVDSTAPDVLRGCATDGPVTVEDPPPVDSDPPTAPVLSFETGPSAHPVGSTLYVNTAGPATETYAVRATTTDAMSGVKEVEFPGGSIDRTAPYRSSPYDLAEHLGSNPVAARDNAGNESVTRFDVVADTTGPAEVAVTYTDGNDDNGTIEVTTSDGIDAGAGVNAASGLLERQLGTLADSPLGPTCANLGAWQQTTPTNTIQQLQCALYRYSVSDNVGNTATDIGVATVWFDNRDRIPPANVTNARVIFGDHVVKLTYRTPTVDFERVKIFRSITGVDGSARLAYNGARRIFTDRTVLNGTRYVYEIVTYDATGNRQDQGVLVNARPRSRFLLTPRDGAVLRRPPRLDWRARPRARFYNVKLLRDIGPGPAREVLSRFPRGSALQLTRTWRNNGVLRRFGPGTYFWYVWPRIGARYGALMGYQQFRVPRR